MADISMIDDMIEIATEQMLTTPEAARILRVSEQTVRRWMLTTGRRDRTLEFVVVGGKRLTSIEAIERFSEQSGRGSSSRRQMESAAATHGYTL